MFRYDKKGQRYLFQDGRHYYLGIDGQWRAERNIFGDEIVEMDIFGNPILERDITGKQILERDIFGNPLVPPKYIQ